ncbi:MAG: site-2 protease family protein [Saprospiraceae bacterium]
MNATFQIAHVFGIPVKVHWTFGFLFLYVGYIGYRDGFTITATLYYLLFTLVLFLCVVLHEFGHALSARKYGVKTKDIILSPIGGVARLMNLPEKPIQEFVIALAGPLVNVVIALLIGIYLFFFHAQGFQLYEGDNSFFDYPGNFLPLLFRLNIILVFFNMIPAFPMDGGRVLRAALSIRWSRYQATRVAAIIGQILALGFVIYGVYESEFMLMFIGFFVYSAAAAEFRSVAAEKALNETEVGDIVTSDFAHLTSFDPMQTPIMRLNEDKEINFLVLDDEGTLKGILPTTQIEEAKRRRDYYSLVVHYMLSQWVAVPVDTKLKDLLAIFKQNGYFPVPIYRQQQLVGMIAWQQLENYLQDIFKNTAVIPFLKRKRKISKKQISVSSS